MAVACDLHLERSVASCKASVGVRQQSLVTWWSQVVGARPRGLFHPVTFRQPSWTSQARIRMALAWTVSGIRAIWPNSWRRRRQTTDSRDSWPEAARTSTLRIKSDHLVPSRCPVFGVGSAHGMLQVCDTQRMSESTSHSHTVTPTVWAKVIGITCTSMQQL